MSWLFFRREKMKTSSFLILAAALGFCFFIFTHLSQSEAKVKEDLVAVSESFETKQTKGTVLAISDDLISVEYYRRGGVSKEILIIVDTLTKFRQYSAIDDVQVGDTARVTYSESYGINADGKHIDYRRVATVIQLIKSVEVADVLLGP